MVELRVIVGVVNVEMGVEMVMLKELNLLLFLLILLITLFLINLNLLSTSLILVHYNL
jgi:hypothetical protein